eukprot:PhM_4_TR1322/c0_g1_i1/m.101035
MSTKTNTPSHNEEGNINNNNASSSAFDASSTVETSTPPSVTGLKTEAMATAFFAEDATATNNNNNASTAGSLTAAADTFVAVPAAVAASLSCMPVLHRTGEMFAEIGVRMSATTSLALDPSAAVPLTRWELRVLREDRQVAHQKVYDVPSGTTTATLPAVEGAKPAMLKLRGNASYLVQTRLCSTGVSWGPWSELGRIRTYPEVVCSVHEVGENYLRISWDRPSRDNAHCLEEITPEGNRVVENLEGFQLKVLREKDMVQEYVEQFAPGTRTHTIHGLAPATTYVVMYSCLTLIHTEKQWTEVARICTQPSFSLSLQSRGEDTFTIGWQRGDLPSLPPGNYLVQHCTFIKFELELTSERKDDYHEPVEVKDATLDRYTFIKLRPSTTYSVRLRYLTAEGRLGPFGAPLSVTTSGAVRVDIASVGQTFCNLTWEQRPVESNVDEVEISVLGVSQAIKRELTIKKSEFTGKNFNVLSVAGLTPGTQYKLFLRVLSGGVWGLWSSGVELMTKHKCWVECRERGEDFLTIQWSNHEDVNTVLVKDVATDEVVLEAETPWVDEGFRITGLSAGKTYTLQVRALEVDTVSATHTWSSYSDPIRASTLRPVALYVVDVGENFAHIAWSRAMMNLVENAASSAAGGDSDSTWQDLKYEFVLGCLDTGVDKIVHREVLQNSFVVGSLVPNTTYVVSVRACDDREQWGLWCRVSFRTLSSVTLVEHEIGEEYIRLMWQRERVNVLPNTDEDDVFTGNAYVSSCTLCVFSVDDPMAATTLHSTIAASTVSSAGDPASDDYAPSLGAEIRRVEHFDSTHASLRVGDLAPDRMYRAVLRAATATGKWGLWSTELTFRTVAPFRISTQNLAIGENYITVAWMRDERPLVPMGTRLGDYRVTSIQLRVRGLETPYERVEMLDSTCRLTKLYGLHPATQYCVQVRACNGTGEWGTWSAQVKFVTRPTIVMRVVEIAEDYIRLSWERRTLEIGPGFLTGKEHINSYHLKVTDKATYLRDEQLIESQCPFTLRNLKPDTIYYAQIMAQYNNEEWGQWSQPLVCLTMKQLQITRGAISEKAIHIRWSRGEQPKRLPAGLADEKETPLLCFGQHRPVYQLRVTTRQPVSTPLNNPSTALATTASGGDEVADECVVIEPELTTEAQEVKFQILDLKSGTVYSMKVRSRLEDGEWGQWSSTVQYLTLAPIVVSFQSIGEDYVKVEWKRQQCAVDGVPTGAGHINRSELKIRDLNGAFLHTFNIDNPATTFSVDKLNPSATYAISVRTHNGHDWGVWGEEARARTLPPFEVFIEKIGEDFVWLSWMRKPELDWEITPESVVVMDNVIKAYDVKLLGRSGSVLHKEVANNSVFLKGLCPDEIFDVRIRAMAKGGVWGLWAQRTFRTLPTLKIRFGNIGEHFATLQWIRMTPSGQTAESVLEGDDIIARFKLKLQRVGQQSTIYYLSNSLSSFKFLQLLPACEYRAWVAAQDIDGEWGMWSCEARFRTLPPMKIGIQHVGEDYVQVQWNRIVWDGDSFKDEVEETATHVPEGVVSEFHVVALSEDDKVVCEVKMPTRTTTCRLTGLFPRNVYSVKVRAKDTYGEYGLWSPIIRFCTLHPVRLNILRVGEDFALLEWARSDALRKMQIERRAKEQEHEAFTGETTDGSAAEEEDVEEEFEDNEAASESDSNPASGRTGGSSPHQNDDDEFDPAAVSNVVDDDSDEEVALPPDVVRGNPEIKKWMVRIYGNKLNGGINSAESMREVEIDANDPTRVVHKLLPGTTYSLQIRGMDVEGTWGGWSTMRTLTTMTVMAVNISYIGEDLFSCSWHRSSHARGAEVFWDKAWNVYPSPIAEHNYELCVQMIVGDNQGGESVTQQEQARIFHTTQPRQTVYDLVPGAYYRVTVREQLSPEVKRLLADDTIGSEKAMWGMFSEQLTMEMAPPMRADIRTIGENYVNFGWGRRASLSTYLTDAKRSTCTITKYDVRVRRMDDRGKDILRGEDSYEFSQNFDPSITGMFLPDLLANTIYSITVRAVTDGEHIGLWSPLATLVTMKPIIMNVNTINENNAVLSWIRHLPDWCKHAPAPLSAQLQSARGLMANEDDDARSYYTEDNAVDETQSVGMGRSSAREGGTNSAAEGDEGNVFIAINGEGVLEEMDHVQMGNYNAVSFELEVLGVGHDYRTTIEISGATTTRLTDMLPNHVYAVRVRSMGIDMEWSPFSTRVALCTLKPLQLTYGKVAENFLWVQWERPSQSIDEFRDMLDDERTTTLRLQKEYEDHIMEMKVKEKFAKQSAAMRPADDGAVVVDREDDEADKPTDPIFSAVTNNERTGGNNHEKTAMFPSALAAAAATPDFDTSFLYADVVVLGRPECTAYHVRICGVSGYPAVRSDDILDGTEGAKAGRRKPVKKGKGTAKGGRKNRPSPGTTLTSGPGQWDRTMTGTISSDLDVTTTPRVAFRDDQPAGLGEIPDDMLLELRFSAKTNKIRIDGLAPGVEYSVVLRGKNTTDEWSAWSPRSPIHTVSPIVLGNSGFGEHYANLFWYRPTPEGRVQELIDQEEVDAWEEKEKVVREDTSKMHEMTQQEKQDFMAERKVAKDKEAALSQLKSLRRDGHGEVVTSNNTVIKGYLLRLIRAADNGEAEDLYFTEAPDVGHLHTFLGLTENNLYIAQIAADYGDNEWGAWSNQLQFMTQNLLQLNIAYIGEHFLQLEWKRNPNRKVKGEEYNNILYNPIAQGVGHQYQVVVEYTVNGERRTNQHTVRDNNNFRVEDLLPDTQYTAKVREWDAKGEWGLWSPSKVCVTLAQMFVKIQEVGENWLSLEWRRSTNRNSVNHEDPNAVVMPVEVEAYYLSLEEHLEGGTTEDEREKSRLEIEETAAAAAKAEADAAAETTRTDSPEVSKDDFDAFIMKVTQKEEKVKTPEERGPFNKYGRYSLVKRLDNDCLKLTLDDLKPSKFYTVRIMCNTKGGEVGLWSTDLYAVTMNTMSLSVDLVAETSINLSWDRHRSRRNPDLKGFVHTQEWQNSEYELSVEAQHGHDGYTLTEKFPQQDRQFRVSGLKMNSIYRVRVRSKDLKGRWSLWSHQVDILTLKAVVVRPMRIAEQFAWIEWAREAQQPNEYPLDDHKYLLITQEKPTACHLRVYAATEPNVPIVDREFAGTVSKHQVTYLSPNTSYIVEARVRNQANEWGMWSAPRYLYTMPLMRLAVTARGENYITLQWWRDAPTLLTLSKDSIRTQSATLTEGMQLTDGDEATDTTLMEAMTERIPNIDAPENERMVFQTIRTTVVKCRVSVQRGDDPEATTYDINLDNDDPQTCMTQIGDLVPNTLHTITVRAFYGDEDWGLWSQAINTCTQNVYAPSASKAGEDYMKLSWSRKPIAAAHEGISVGMATTTVCYQLRILDSRKLDVAPVPDENIVKDIYVTSECAYVRGLLPNYRHCAIVRRWYLPMHQLPLNDLVEFAKQPPLSSDEKYDDITTSMDPKEIPDYMDKVSAVPGAWSEGIFVATLKPMVVVIDDIAEEFFNARWERDSSLLSFPARSVTRLVSTIEKYQVRIDQLIPDGSAVDNSMNTVHADQMFGPADTAFQVASLRADTLYRIEVRAQADGVWGVWSSSRCVITLPKITVSVTSVGEDYATLQWERKIRSLTLGDGTECVIGNTTSIAKYQLVMYGTNNFRLDKKFKPNRTSYKVKRLDPNIVYNVTIRSADYSDKWSNPSERITFATLKPLHLTFGRVSENFVHVSWNRDPQQVEEYANSTNPETLALGDAVVTKYHLCVFPAEHGPTTAFVDKQFSGDISNFLVTSLNPNTTYIFIVRACNNDGSWGLWSEERTITTLPLLTVRLICVGENYIAVSWTREDSISTAPEGTLALADVTAYHVFLTGVDNGHEFDDVIPVDSLQYENGAPVYSIRSLKPDSRYVITLQASYGTNEWGLRTAPITFLTLNQLGLMVKNIGESSADFHWGRSTQQHSDGNVKTFKGDVTKYVLVIRCLTHDGHKVAQRALTSMAPALGTTSNSPAMVEALPDGEQQPQGDAQATTQQSTNASDGNSPVVEGGTGQQQEGTAEPAGVEPGTVVPTTTATDDPTLLGDDVFVVEKEMERNQFNYIQTYCAVNTLTVNTEYIARIRAMDDRKEWGEWTETQFETRPLPPTRVMLRKGGNKVIITWEAPDTIHRYQYQVEQAIIRPDGKRSKGGKSEDLEWKVVDTPQNETQSEVRTQVQPSKLRFRIRCCKMDRPVQQWSAYSATATFASAQPPDPVPGYKLISVSTTAATIEWLRPAGSSPTQGSAASVAAAHAKTQFRVYLGAREAQQALLGTTKNTTYTLTDLEPNTQYRFYVVVETDTGLSARNQVFKFATRPEVHPASKARGSSRTSVDAPASPSDSVKLPNISKSSPGTTLEPRPPSSGESRVAQPPPLMPKKPQQGGVSTQPHPPPPPSSEASTMSRRPQPKTVPPHVLNQMQRAGVPPDSRESAKTQESMDLVNLDDEEEEEEEE